MLEENILGEDLCRPARPGHVLFPETRNITQHILLCKHMKAKISVVENEEIDFELTELLLNSGITLPNPNGT